MMRRKAQDVGGPCLENAKRAHAVRIEWREGGPASCITKMHASDEQESRMMIIGRDHPGNACQTLDVLVAGRRADQGPSVAPAGHGYGMSS